MRSLMQIVKPGVLHSDCLNEVTNQYVKELLAITKGDKFYLAGNCQAAVIAYWMAKELGSMDCCPEKLFLMEWTSSWGPYQGATVFLYGEGSYSRFIYEDEQEQGHPWKIEFPYSKALSIQGQHAKFFNDVNVVSLAARVKIEL